MGVLPMNCHINELPINPSSDFTRSVYCTYLLKHMVYLVMGKTINVAKHFKSTVAP